MTSTDFATRSDAAKLSSFKTLAVKNGRLRIGFVVCLFACLALVITASLLLGRFEIKLGDLWVTLLAPFTGDSISDRLDSVVWNLRVPRILLAIVVGAGLAAAGSAMQSLFSNPLATPDTLGVTAGASVGAVVAMLFSLPLLGVQFLSLAFGIAAVGLTVLIARSKGRSNIVMLVLAGVVVAALSNAILSMLKLVADPDDKLPEITYWLMGSLARASYDTLSIGAPLILVGLAAIFLLRWRLNVLALGEDEAKASGMNVKQLRFVIIVSATLITAASISMCGQVGWISLLVPHCARMICGNNNRLNVPVSILMGAIFLVLIDTMARTITPSEIPISIITAIIGAPFFIVLLRKTGGSWS